MFDHSSGQMFPGLVVACFLVSLLEPTFTLLVDFCGVVRNVSHLSMVQTETVTCLQYSNYHQWLPHGQC